MIITSTITITTALIKPTLAAIDVFRVFEDSVGLPCDSFGPVCGNSTGLGVVPLDDSVALVTCADTVEDDTSTVGDDTVSTVGDDAVIGNDTVEDGTTTVCDDDSVGDDLITM